MRNPILAANFLDGSLKTVLQQKMSAPVEALIEGQGGQAADQANQCAQSHAARGCSTAAKSSLSQLESAIAF